MEAICKDLRHGDVAMRARPKDDGFQTIRRWDSDNSKVGAQTILRLEVRQYYGWRRGDGRIQQGACREDILTLSRYFKIPKNRPNGLICLANHCYSVYNNAADL